ncbi:hypothetical protein EGI20_08715 [Aquitalea sp. S1-19]|nr:hypothetical protein [Aquitalea sp. S1-19]
MHSQKIEINKIVLSPIEDCGLVFVSNDPTPAEEGVRHGKSDFLSMSTSALSFVTVRNYCCDDDYFYHADFIIYDCLLHKMHEGESSNSIWTMTNISRFKIEEPGVLEPVPESELIGKATSFVQNDTNPIDGSLSDRKKTLFNAARNSTGDLCPDWEHWTKVRAIFLSHLLNRRNNQLETFY